MDPKKSSKRPILGDVQVISMLKSRGRPKAKPKLSLSAAKEVKSSDEADHTINVSDQEVPKTNKTKRGRKPKQGRPSESQTPTGSQISIESQPPRRGRKSKQTISESEIPTGSQTSSEPQPPKRGRKPKQGPPSEPQTPTGSQTSMEAQPAKRGRKPKHTPPSESQSQPEAAKPRNNRKNSKQTTTKKVMNPKPKPARKKTKSCNNKKHSDSDHDETLTVTSTPEGFWPQSSFSHNLPPTPTDFKSNPTAVAPEVIYLPPSFNAIAPAPPSEENPLKNIDQFIQHGINILNSNGINKYDSLVIMDGTALNAIRNHIVKNRARSDSTRKLTDSFEDCELHSSSIKPRLLFESPNLSTIASVTETPADTPLVTPPPKSPAGPDTPLVTPPPKSFAGTETTSVRRSHRRQESAKTPKALVGCVLVCGKAHLSLTDAVETKTAYTIDYRRMDLAEATAKNTKFLKEMEEHRGNFCVLKENKYRCERVISKETKEMTCDCFLTAEEEKSGEMACGKDCLNRLLMIECGPKCAVKDRCANKRFQKFLHHPCRIFRTKNKGFGITTDIEILPGEFIMEYVGEVIDSDEFERRRMTYSLEKNRHYYFMALRSNAIIDATNKGGISRFINHSCYPNAETQKWTVKGELRIGFFSKKSIMPGEEITFNYQYQRYGREAQRCYCESSNCSGWIGQEPNSDEGEQIDGDSDGDEEEDDYRAESLLADNDKAAEAKPENVLPTNDKEKQDSKRQFQRLVNKLAEKVANRKKLKKRKHKQCSFRKDDARGVGAEMLPKSRYLEDPDIEDEVHFLSRRGLKYHSDTLRLSRLMVRVKLVQTRLNLLKILRSGDLPCRRLFLDYHGLRLLHSWISEDGKNLNIRMAMLETLASLPIANKTMLTDSKVYQAVRSWCSNEAGTERSGSYLSVSDESNESTSLQPKATHTPPREVPNELKNLGLKLTARWDSLPEGFRASKWKRIEQMKKHEREVDHRYAVTTARYDEPKRSNTDRYRGDRFRPRSASNGSRRFKWIPSAGQQPRNAPMLVSGVRSSRFSSDEGTKRLTKEHRREIFTGKVAHDDAEKRLAEERREFETKCRFFGLDKQKTRRQDLPFSVNPRTGQWYSAERQEVPIPPSHAYVQCSVKPQSTNPTDYQLPAAVANLSQEWKFTITPQGKIFYYHVRHRVPQWEPPTPGQMYSTRAVRAGGATASDSGSDHTTDNDDELLKNMHPLKVQDYVRQRAKIRRNRRRTQLVTERAISPRRKEDSIRYRLQTRKYKENKEKVRKRKEAIRRRYTEAMRKDALSKHSPGSPDEEAKRAGDTTHQSNKTGTDYTVLPIPKYLLSSDDEDNDEEESNRCPPLTQQTLKRPLASNRELEKITELHGGSVAPTVNAAEQQEPYKKYRAVEEKSRQSGKRSEEPNANNLKIKRKFRCEISGTIVDFLKQYREDSCKIGRIQSNDDFNHLARKLTHFVMIKEQKYCKSVGHSLLVTESVRYKSCQFIKTYMSKEGDVYVKPSDDPYFKSIPYTI